MRIILCFLLVFSFCFSLKAQHPIGDKLEQLYYQGHYSIVYRKSAKYINKEETKNLLAPKYYFAISSLQKSNNIFMTNKLFYFLWTLATIILTYTAYEWGYHNGINKGEEVVLNKPQETKDTYIYNLKEGTNGLLRFSVGDDSLADVTYVLDGDTFEEKGLIRSQFDSLVLILYPEMMEQDSAVELEIDSLVTDSLVIDSAENTGDN
ncbi:MAG: hypothetical protein ACKOKB_03950, partial [Bacteroidota bacterium]